MKPEDAYIYADLTEAEATEAEADEGLQRRIMVEERKLEFELLQNLRDINENQTQGGKANHMGTVWSLEHLYERYYKSAKGSEGGDGTINLVFKGGESDEDLFKNTEVVIPELETK